MESKLATWLDGRAHVGGQILGILGLGFLIILELGPKWKGLGRPFGMEGLSFSFF